MRSREFGLALAFVCACLLATRSFAHAEPMPARISMDITSVRKLVLKSGESMARVTLRFKNAGSMPYLLSLENTHILSNIWKKRADAATAGGIQILPHAFLGCGWENQKHVQILLDGILIRHESVRLLAHSAFSIDCDIKAPAKPGKYTLLVLFDNNDRFEKCASQKTAPILMPITAEEMARISYENAHCDVGRSLKRVATIPVSW